MIPIPFSIHWLDDKGIEIGSTHIYARDLDAAITRACGLIKRGSNVYARIARGFYVRKSN